ncbi:YggT family protein [Hyphomonas sp.]|jgi:YggT family protein|uniref:YggT family protein n=1 Tax=Hyphomonas sp. TaxID=87 RepID=UPI0025C696DE|nr:YggT family protein [Hyphomonas sp.]MBI1401396.1 YggT family protein [Hyphomonas sp.]
MKAILDVLYQILNIASWIIIIQAILSWLVMFKVIDTRNSVVASIWGALERLTEPLYRPIRNMLPAMSGLDISPLIVLLIIFFLQQVILRYGYSLAPF